MKINREKLWGTRTRNPSTSNSKIFQLTWELYKAHKSQLYLVPYPNTVKSAFDLSGGWGV